MKLQELYEGVTPKLPGAVKGIKIMTPQQFVAQAGDEESTPQDLNEAEIRDRAMKLLKGIGKVGSKGIRGVWWAVNHPVQAIALAAAVTHPKETYNAANFAWNLVTDPARVATVLSKYGYNSVVPWGNTKQAQQDLNDILGNSATSDMIFKLGGLAVQYAIPIAGVIALLYGGKLFADYLNSSSQEEAGKKVFDQIRAELSRDKPTQVKETLRTKRRT